MQSRKIIIANWKMQQNVDDSVLLAQKMRTSLEASSVRTDLDIVICPSFDSLADVSDVIEGSRIRLGAQNVFWQEKGAYTGEIAASMLRALGCVAVIIGHSERRRYLNEDDEMINRKVHAALAEGLVPILCVGETYEERTAGLTDLVIMRQVIEGLKGIVLQPHHRLIVAYEPVWVIGTGQAIEPPQAFHASKVVMQSLIDLFSLELATKQTRIIYGGSVDEGNIVDYVSLSTIQGALVGGASLSASKFISLLEQL